MFGRWSKANRAKEAGTSSFFSLNDLDRKLRQHISKRNGYFIELGANDGLTYSNTLHFERELGWRGVLIEPIPHRYLECRRNRSAETKVFCAACVPEGFEDRFVEIVYSDMMTVAPALDLDLDPQAHAKVGTQFLGSHETNFSFGALARTLTGILDEAGAPSDIDLLSLDVEGGELDVLRGLDLNKYKIRHMVVESRNVARIADYTKPYGYKLIETLSDCDYLFVREGQA